MRHLFSFVLAVVAFALLITLPPLASRVLAPSLAPASGATATSRPTPSPSPSPVTLPTLAPPTPTRAPVPATPTPSPLPPVPSPTQEVVAPPTPRGPLCPPVTAVDTPFLPPVAARPSAALARVIEQAVAGRQGEMAVAVKNLVTGESAAHNAERIYEAASLYKLNLMYGAFALMEKGEVDFEAELIVSEKAAYGYGDGDPSLEPGETLAVDEAVRCAITVSDNVSAHALLEYLPVWKVNAEVASLGLAHTEILDGTRTTASDMLHFMDLVATGRLLSPNANQAMLSLLLAQQVNDRLPFLLPEGALVAHKTGNLPGLRHDVGVVYAPGGPYAIAVLVDGLPDDAELTADDPDPGSRAIAELSRAVYDYFAAPPSPVLSPTITDKNPRP